MHAYLIEHVRDSGFNLRLDDFVPDGLGLDSLSGAAFFFISLVEGFELLAENVLKPRSLVGAEKRPVLILLDAFHEKVWNPKCVEKVAGPRLVGACVFLGVQKLENVGVPGFEVNCKSPGALVAALVYIPRF